MKTKLNLLVYIYLFITALAFSGVANARIVCWTNHEGVRECGNAIPPEFAQKQHEEISEQGMVLEEKERAKTAEEIAEEKRLADIEAEKTRIAEEQAAKDKILLDTFSSIDDIEMTRDGKISAIDATIKATNKRTEKIQADLDKRIEAAAAEERAGKAPPESLLEDIESLRRQISNNANYIETKQQEQEQIRAGYELDIERFKKLKNISSE